MRRQVNHWFRYGLLLPMTLSQAMAAEIVLDEAVYDREAQRLRISAWVQGETAGPISSVELIDGTSPLAPTTREWAPQPEWPVCYLLMTDTSLSMRNFFSVQVIPLLKALVAEKNEWHRYAIGGFDAGLTVLQDFTEDPAPLLAAIDRLELKGQRTELFRSSLQGLDELKNCDGYRRILVLVSDGDAEDLPGAYGPNDVIQAAQNAKISVVSLGVKDSIEQQNLRRLAESTGGRYSLYRAGMPLTELGAEFFQRTDTGLRLTIDRDALPDRVNDLYLEVSLVDGQSLKKPLDLNIPDRQAETSSAANVEYFSPILLAFVAVLLLILIMLIVKRRKRVLEPITPQQPESVSETHTPSTDDSLPKAQLRHSSGQVFLIDRRSIRIGALDDNDVVIDDPTVSRYQAIIDFKDGVYYLTDRGATNPSMVNGQAESHCRLQSGDVIQFGRWQAVFEEL
ncbi:FHA domain-containing protein [Methylotuvimicrobium alcaliphilum]|uniref:FHA domain-containing protein n=1 Tax=Methylotuvimicrobium alcaliphilum (strain DSM 19304 / NCIMB 14124 / VKM B-2133 / 20Z) TaxID=1091494 RepID=G4T459_META2|nr:FHA domain-containing protein [Methylotuvimicrobium alcaliphilum]CCE23794.1 exported protein of unknown function [Methylotuvimicrobium alcaliphilum 20Z]